MPTTSQIPLSSGFDAFSTSNDVMAGISLDGATAIVTGGYSGLGLETTRSLVRAGAHVIVPARDVERAAVALRDVPGAEVESLDLADPVSIDGFARRFIASGRALDLLVNSAGVMATPFALDSRGHESQFAINHLGHFRLTTALWPALAASGKARVISVSSRGHHIAPMDFDDVSFVRRQYDKWVAYGQSKTANALFAVELDRRGQTDGIRAFSVHPGTVLGPLARHLTAEEISRFGVHDAGGKVIVDPLRDLKTAAQGAATALWCATSLQLDGMGGVYCEDCDVALLAEPNSELRAGVRPWAADRGLAERLWELSEQLSGR